MELSVETEHLEDGRALVEHLEPVLGTPERVVIGDLGGGNANETVHLRWDDDAYVLRIPAEADLAPAMLADLERERAALAAMANAPVPAPAIHHHSTDPPVLGREFLVLDFVDGEVPETTLPEGLDTPAARAQLADDVVAALAGIHDATVPPEFADDPATPGAYLAAEIETFREQLAWAEERTAERRRVDRLHGLLDRLETRRPDRAGAAATLVHGDFKPDNWLLGPDGEGVLQGVLDWEMAGRGDPLADLGWLLSYWGDQGDPPLITDDLRERYADHDFFPILEVFVDEYGAFTAHPDTPDRAALVDRYERETGREYRDDAFYRALGAAKLAVIGEGFFRAYLAGTAAKDSYPAMELIPFVLAEQGHQVLDGRRPLRH
jgi:aminoglycoside phosphotransferase (APT) family kinase protein